MKKLFLFLLLILLVVMVQPAQATLYTGKILYVNTSVTSPFTAAELDTFNWTATWTGSPTDGWVSANTLRIPVDPYQYLEVMDADYPVYPRLHFTGSVLDGVDALAVDWLKDINTWYHFTTNTPLTLVGDPAHYEFDYLTFSVFSTNESLTALYEAEGWPGNGNTTIVRTEVLNGVLYTSPSAVPIPAPILLLGTGLIGLAGFRRKMKP